MGVFWLFFFSVAWRGCKRGAFWMCVVGGAIGASVFSIIEPGMVMVMI